MQATAHSATLTGLHAELVRVEVDSGRGVPMFHIVGLPEASVRESRMRVRAALARLGVELNEWVLTVNLAPADVRKSGGAFDLAIACALLAALGKLPVEALGPVLLLGELSLGGTLRPVRGVLPALRGAARAGIEQAIVPPGNGAEAAVIEGVETLVAPDLAAVLRHLCAEAPLARATRKPFEPAPSRGLDLAEVRGQHSARRALEIAAAGGHDLLMVGPPGAGKTMLARRLPSLLPPLSLGEALDVTAIHSVAGLLPAGQGLIEERPFRAPHHTVSAAALLGGGEPLRPGEMSLAHHGCLFLDELCEFQRHVLDGMRQPLETGELVICRARSRAVFPARPLLVAAVNPCPCGYHGHPSRPCHCSAVRVENYRNRLSGPLLDRIDLQVVLPPVALAALQDSAPGESSQAVRARVFAARARQTERHAAGLQATPLNRDLSHAEAAQLAAPDEESRRFLTNVAERLGLSARGYVRLGRVARTVADLEGTTGVELRHFRDAVRFRTAERSHAGALRGEDANAPPPRAASPGE